MCQRILLAYGAEFRLRPLRTIALTIVVASCAMVAAAAGTFMIPYWLQAPQREQAARLRLSVDSALAIPRTWPSLELRDFGSAVAKLRTTCEPSQLSGYMGTLKYDLQIAPADSIIARLRHFSLEPSRVTILFFGSDGFKAEQIVVDASHLAEVRTGDGQRSLVANDAGGSCNRSMLNYRTWSMSWSLPPDR
jgi:hypothetical protein